MATVDATTAAESGKAGAAPAPPAASRSFSGADLALRALLFAVTLAGLVVLATAKQTALVPVTIPLPQAPRFVFVSMPAKFKDAPALIYLLVALCVTCFYSLLTALASLKLIFGSSPTKTLFLLVLLDALYAAIMASATGSGGGVAWIGLKGNTHTNWNKICNIYGTFCRHIGASVFLGLIASILLLLLTVLNAHALYRRSR